MSQISNRFYVTALDDGTTLHGNLVANKSLTQAWNGSSAVPDWGNPTYQPTIYLTLLSGTDFVAGDVTNITWLINGVTISSSDSRFQMSRESYTYNGTTYSNVPYLKIVQNLASSGNVDVDVITFQGSYDAGGSTLPVSCDIQVRISAVDANGFLGIINFVDGIADITEKEQVITMYATLFGGAGGGEVPGFTTKWFVNDVEYNASDTTHFTPNKTKTRTVTVNSFAYQGFDLYEKDVTDHAIIKCEMRIDSNLVYTAYAAVDDMQDTEFMYIQYNGANGNSASLRNGESVKFYIWVGKREDPTVDTDFSVFKVKFLNGSGSVITGTQTGLPNPQSGDTDGWRTITGRENGKAILTLTYDTVVSFQKNLTGLILASTSV